MLVIECSKIGCLWYEVCMQKKEKKQRERDVVLEKCSTHGCELERRRWLALLYLYKKLRPARATVGSARVAVGADEGCGSDQWRVELESSDSQMALPMLCFIVKQRSQLEKMIDGYSFTERGWRLGSNGSRVETTRLDSVIVASRGLLLLSYRG
ncbi:hypothetical protein GW17_00059937 [Ensete ventricosum]|nr:hypothetical protein GW17_00059937 [Ensete ventricosum]